MQSLDTPFQWLEGKLGQFFDNKFWQIRILVLGLVISATILLALNSTYIDYGFRHLYYEMLEPGCCNGFYWDDIIRQGKYPFTVYPFTPGSHESNVTFRLTVPLFVRILHLNVATLYLLHVLAGLLFLWLVIKIVDDLLKDHVLTFYFVTGFMGTYIGLNFYFNYIGHADAFPFLFMLLTFYTRQPLLLLGYSQLAFWCDERAILNLPYIYVWYILPIVHQLFKEKAFHFKQIPVLLKQTPSSVIILVISVGVYVAVRQWLTYKYGLHISHGYEFTRKVLLENLTIMGARLANGFEGLWFVIIGGLAVSILKKDTWTILLLGSCLLVTIASSLLVIDITRSLSFGFIGIFIALRILKEYTPRHQLRQLLILSMIVSLMFTITFP